MNTPVARKLAAVDARRVAAARAAREAAARRRAVAAKRRMLLLSVLGGVTISAWILTSMVSFPWVLSGLLTASTIAVVELGRRAASAGATADAELAERVADAERRAARAPLAMKVANKRSEQIDFAEESAAPAEPASSLRVSADPEVQVESSWTPVPVPPPAYTLKAEVRRKAAEPYVDEAGEESAAGASAKYAPEKAVASQPAAAKGAPAGGSALSSAEESADRARATEGGAASSVSAQEEPAATTGSMSVQEILARRRAVG